MALHSLALSAALVNRVFADDDAVSYCYSRAGSESRESFVRSSYDVEPLTLTTGQRIVVLRARTGCLCGAQNCPFLAYLQRGEQFQLALRGAAIDDRFETNGTAVVTSHDSALVSFRDTYVFRSSRYVSVKSEMVNEETGEAKPSEIPVRFAAGTSSTKVRGRVVMGFPDTYIVTAKKGQRIHVELSPRNASAEVYVADGLSQGLAPPAQAWSGTLPASGDYRIIVDGTSEKSAQYELTISIDPLPATSWNHAKPGALAFVSAMEGDAAVAPICPTTKNYPHLLHDNNPVGCKIVPQGTAATIISIERVRGDYGLYGRDLLVAKVRLARGSIIMYGNVLVVARGHVANGSVTGYIALELLNPPVPSGAEVVLMRFGDENPRLASSQRDQGETGLPLASGTRARVILFDPKVTEGHDLKVRIISGRYAGRTGWVWAATAVLPDRTPIVPFQP
jgi:hypothetical protein